jgi:hypothetical protein
MVEPGRNESASGGHGSMSVLVRIAAEFVIITVMCLMMAGFWALFHYLEDVVGFPSFAGMVIRFTFGIALGLIVFAHLARLVISEMRSLAELRPLSKPKTDIDDTPVSSQEGR